LEINSMFFQVRSTFVIVELIPTHEYKVFHFYSNDKMGRKEHDG
jgi:hypothetical protein